MYADEEDFNDNNSPSTTASQSRFDHNNITSHLNEYIDENSSYHEDDFEEENHIYGDTMSVNRIQPNYPTIPFNNKKPIDFQSTSRMPVVSSNLWRDLFSKPAILVGQ